MIQELRAQQESVPAEALRWPGPAPLPDLPEGLTWKELLERHCPRNFIKNYRRGGPVIYVAHRGFILFPDRPDNSMESYIAACEFGAGIVELDVAILRRMLPDDEATFILGHDRTAERKTAYSTSAWSDLTPTEAIGLPHIVREVKDTHFTNRYYVTEQKVGSISLLEETLLTPIADHRGMEWCHEAAHALPRTKSVP